MRDDLLGDAAGVAPNTRRIQLYAAVEALEDDGRGLFCRRRSSRNGPALLPEWTRPGPKLFSVDWPLCSGYRTSDTPSRATGSRRKKGAWQARELSQRSSGLLCQSIAAPSALS